MRRLRERLRYRFDEIMTKGTPALVGWLGLASLALVALISLLVTFLVPEEAAHGGVWWLSMVHTLDTAGLHNDHGSVTFMGLMLAATIGGIFIVSSLIGVLTTGLNTKIAELRKGRSKVVESGHVVILGWSDQLFTIVSELISGSDGERMTIAILAPRDKVAMEDELHMRVGRTGRVRIVCRTGNPNEATDLDIVRPDEARVILLPEADVAFDDVDVIKTLLALQHRPWPKNRPLVVAAVAASQNLRAAVLAGGPSAKVVDGDDITARLLVQSRRQPGLSAVCTELLDFDGDEIYMRREPALIGLAYSQALQAYQTATVMGLRLADGSIQLNPPADTVIGPHDDIVLLARSHAAVRLAKASPTVADELMIVGAPTCSQVEQTLILGWNDRGSTILKLLDQYQQNGSSVHIAASPPAAAAAAAFAGGLSHLSITISSCDTTDSTALEALSRGAYQHVMVLSDDGLSADRADARTLVTLLHLRDIKERLGETFAIVSELKDDGNRRLATVTHADDFVVGSRMIGLMLTQLSTNSRLGEVFTELLSPGGVDIYLEPAEAYVHVNKESNFATVIEAAQRRGETAIGYRLSTETHKAPTYGVTLNPDKANPLTLTIHDRIIVLTKARSASLTY